MKLSFHSTLSPFFSYVTKEKILWEENKFMKEKFTLWSFWDELCKVLLEGFELYCPLSWCQIFMRIIGSVHVLRWVEGPGGGGGIHCKFYTNFSNMGRGLKSSWFTARHVGEEFHLQGYRGGGRGGQNPVLYSTFVESSIRSHWCRYGCKYFIFVNFRYRNQIQITSVI